MTKTLRIASLAATAIAVALGAAPASAVTPTTQATASATIKKPLTIARKTDLSFGDILLSGSGTFTNQPVTISQSGTLTCPTTYFTCSGTTSAASYNVSGNKQSTVALSVPTTLVLTNAANDQLTLNVSAPTSVILTNSGAPGTDFGIGGTLNLSDTTPDGVYSGTFNVSADYQ